MNCKLDERHYHVLLHRKGILSNSLGEVEIKEEGEAVFFRKLTLGWAYLIGLFTNKPRVGIMRHEKDQDITHLTAAEFRRFQGYQPNEAWALAEADGNDYVVEVPEDDYLTVTVIGDADGDITVLGSGARLCHARRRGQGQCYTLRRGQWRRAEVRPRRRPRPQGRYGGWRLLAGWGGQGECGQNRQG